MNGARWRQSGHSKGQNGADFQSGITNVPHAAHTVTCQIARQTRYRGGTSQQVSPRQQTVKVSTTSAPGHQKRLWKQGSCVLCSEAKQSREWGPHAASKTINISHYISSGILPPESTLATATSLVVKASLSQCHTKLASLEIRLTLLETNPMIHVIIYLTTIRSVLTRSLVAILLTRVVLLCPLINLITRANGSFAQVKSDKLLTALPRISPTYGLFQLMHSRSQDAQ